MIHAALLWVLASGAIFLAVAHFRAGHDLARKFFCAGRISHDHLDQSRDISDGQGDWASEASPLAPLGRSDGKSGGSGWEMGIVVGGYK